ncbi:MAG TPA: tetratricopeptide repeat protein [Pseudolabrys sp.]|nr:tetratricopeptide repeat protein [Pseudolabrys sp.]
MSTRKHFMIGLDAPEDFEKIFEKANTLSEVGMYAEAVPLFERLYKGHETLVAPQLGFIYSQEEFEGRNNSIAARYYRVAAESGDAYSQYALAGLLRRSGDPEQAMEWYRRASSAGHGTASYMLFQMHRSRGNKSLSEQFFRLAVQQGNPIAIQRFAIRQTFGRYGIGAIPSGIWTYFSNMRNLLRFVRSHVPRG